MGNKVYVPPKRNPRIKSGGNICITSSHKKPYRKDNKPAHNRAVHPDEAQQEATTELNPIYVNPDGSVNYFAGLTISNENKTESDPEDK